MTSFHSPVRHLASERLYAPRAYQERACGAVRAKWAQGARSVLLVSPTGSGKTVLGATLVESGARSLWVAHRRELIEQAATKLEQLAGVGAVNRVMPGVPSKRRFPDAKIQVGTIQTLLRRERIADVDLLVLDEAHRYAADEYRTIAESYRGARLLGLTATPERHDGRPLGDIFEALVVAAQHSELIAGGHIMRLRVVRPVVALGSDLAAEPVQAYAQHSDGGRAFLFAPTVELASTWARDFRRHSVPAGCVEGATPRRFRARALAGFARGDTRVLTSVYTLNEGLDVPEASVAILARSFEFDGGYLQAVGRIVRPAAGKQVAIVIDLTGASQRHGSPNEDREYSLNGRAIQRRGPAPERERAEREDPTVIETAFEIAEAGAMPSDWRPRPVELKIRTRAERDHAEAEAVFRKHGARAADFFARYQARMHRE